MGSSTYALGKKRCSASVVDEDRILSLRIVSLIVGSFVAETIIENAGAANQAGRIFYDFFDSLRDSIWSA